MSQRSILLVEDSDEDFEALDRILRKLPRQQPVTRLQSAARALNYLLARGEFRQAPRPSLILLDLNLPGMDGRALLQAIKAEEQIRDIPVVIMSTSDNPRDVSFCYRHGAAAYHVKPMELAELRHTMQTMLVYWFDVAVLPGAKEISS